MGQWGNKGVPRGPEPAGQCTEKQEVKEDGRRQGKGVCPETTLGMGVVVREAWRVHRRRGSASRSRCLMGEPSGPGGPRRISDPRATAYEAPLTASRTQASPAVTLHPAQINRGPLFPIPGTAVLPGGIKGVVLLKPAL